MERGVRVIVCDKFKQYHGFSNVGWQNRSLNSSICSQTICARTCYFLWNRYFLILFKEPLVLHTCGSHSAGIIKTSCTAKVFANLKLSHQICTKLK